MTRLASVCAFTVAALSAWTIAIPVVPRQAPIVNSTCTILAPNSGASIPGNGSVAAYLAPENSLMQSSQSATTPQDFSLAFRAQNGAVFHLESYMTFHLFNTTQYDTKQCAQKCNTEPVCEAFNFYFERDPMYEDRDGTGCMNPPPVTNVYCALYNQTLNVNTTTNSHQFDANDHESAFEKVIVGSNGYNRVHKYQAPVSHVAAGDIGDFSLIDTLNESAIDASLTNDSYITYVLFSDAEYSPERCATACLKNEKVCTFFNSYLLLKNNKSVGTYCALFGKSWGAKYATNEGYFHDQDHYTIEQSQTYALDAGSSSD